MTGLYTESAFSVITIPHSIRFVDVGNWSNIQRMNLIHMGSICYNVFQVIFLGTALSHFIQVPWDAISTVLV